jgi:hypothetical protein
MTALRRNYKRVADQFNKQQNEKADMKVELDRVEEIKL